MSSYFDEGWFYRENGYLIRIPATKVDTATLCRDMMAAYPDIARFTLPSFEFMRQTITKGPTIMKEDSHHSTILFAQTRRVRYPTMYHLASGVRAEALPSSSQRNAQVPKRLRDKSQVGSSPFPNISDQITPVCMCKACGNKPLFPTVSDAYKSIMDAADSNLGFGSMVKFKLNGFTTITLPMYTGRTIVTHSVSNNPNTTRKYPTLRKFLCAVARHPNIRSVVAKMEFTTAWTFGSPVDIRFKRDHEGNLFALMSRNDRRSHESPLSIVIAHSDLMNICDAYNSTQIHPNADHACQVLFGVGPYVARIPPPLPRRQPIATFPLFTPLLEISDNCQVLRPTLDNCLPSLCDSLLELVCKYVSTADNPIAGSMVDSPIIQHFFHSPIADPNILTIIGLLAFTPANHEQRARNYLN